MDGLPRMPTIGFDLIKINDRGTRQQRRLVVSSQGLANLKGSSTQWAFREEDVYGIQPDPQDTTGKKFRLTVFHHYSYEARNAEEVKRIQQVFRDLKLGVLAKQENGSPTDITSPLVSNLSSFNFENHDAVASASSNDAKIVRGGGKKVGLIDFKQMVVVGRGAFGKVSQVKKISDGKIYAMKSLKIAEVVAKKQVDHVLAERDILASVQHPFLVQLHYSFREGERLYMILEFVNGGEMFYHLRRSQGNRFSENIAGFYIAEIILALEYLHNRDVIYRDLKPENILLGSDGHVKLTDFGLSKGDISSVVGKDDGVSTSTFCGTPEYLAPEIIRGESHGKAVDWWALGILFYELLVGRTPFYAQNRNDIYRKAMSGGDIQFPAMIPLCAEAKSLVRGLLMRDPANRLGSSLLGAGEIKNHAFFTNYLHMDWDSLLKKELSPPIIPDVKQGESDIANFEPAFLKQNVTETVVVSQEWKKDPSVLNRFDDFDFSREESN